MTSKHYTRMDSAVAGESDGDQSQDRGQAPSRERPTPNVPIRASQMVAREWSQGARFKSFEVDLGDLGGCREIGVNLVEVPPGKQTCPHHYHVHEEEHFYVLEGQIVLRSGDTRYPMAAGDYVCFPAGTGVAHSFENPYSESCRLMAIGSRKDHEVAVYPDSRKMKLRPLGIIVPLPEDGLDYWDGEPVDQPVAQIVARIADQAADSTPDE